MRARRVRARLRLARCAVDGRVLRLVRRLGRCGPPLYYLARPGAFGFEQAAVLAGRRRHRDLADPSGPLHALRRNVHRLEKGLIMRPRQPVFGVDCIAETVELFAVMHAGAPALPPARPGPAGDGYAADLAWAHDVLVQYFAAVAASRSATVARSARRFAPYAARHPAAGSAPARGPFVPAGLPAGAASIEALTALAAHRRSVRWFADKAVDRAVLDRALRVGATAPSACNRQSLKFLVFDAPERVRAVLAVPMGAAGFRHQVPCVVMVVGQLRGYAAERDRHVVYVDGSLAAMSFVLAVEAQGLGTCCLNWPAVPSLERRLRQQVELADDEVVVLLIAVGHPDPEAAVPYSAKRSLHQLVEYNRP